MPGARRSLPKCWGDWILHSLGDLRVLPMLLILVILSWEGQWSGKEYHRQLGKKEPTYQIFRLQREQMNFMSNWLIKNTKHLSELLESSSLPGPILLKIELNPMVVDDSMDQFLWKLNSTPWSWTIQWINMVKISERKIFWRIYKRLRQNIKIFWRIYKQLRQYMGLAGSDTLALHARLPARQHDLTHFHTGTQSVLFLTHIKMCTQSVHKIHNVYTNLFF